MSHQRLHPIYVALDGHQYSKAIKLCQQPQHANNPMAAALLAHAYVRNGQALSAMLVIQSMIGKDCFPELQTAIDRLEQQERRRQQPETTAAPAQAPRKTKKGKKKPATPVKPTTFDNDKPVMDLIQQLDQQPTLPEDWERLPPADTAPADATLVSTLSLTLRNHLRLPLTAYQVACWAASSASTDAQNQVALLSKAFLAGLHVLVAPHYQHLTATILANMQVLALQLARLQQQLFGASPATAWAAQTVLWQLSWTNNNDADPKAAQRRLMLPRLAESLASKAVGEQPVDSSDSLLLTEHFTLYCQTLERQDKLEELLAVIKERLSTGEELVYPPRPTLLDKKSQVLQQLKRYTEAREVLEQELLEHYPDNWSYWRRHMECVTGEADSVDGLVQTQDFVEQLLASDKVKAKYPLRGPWLVPVSIAAQRLDHGKAESAAELPSLSEQLSTKILEYGEQFGPKASCTFSDLRPYLHLLLDSCPKFPLKDDPLLLWLQSIAEPSSTEPKGRRAELRYYILRVQMLYTIVERRPRLKDEYLPNWLALAQVWKDFQQFDPVGDDDQKENRPADELLSLAVQQLWLDADSIGDSRLLAAASLLEAGMSYSPDNAHLKIAAMLVYAQLRAPARAWELWQGLFIKHIQYESCAYLILPILWSGGLYQETITVCKEIVRLQRVAVQDAGEFSGRAMEHGALSKADEFVRFHRARMNQSLTTLEAKGLILDAAPLFSQNESNGTLGSIHGIVGGEADFERATQIVEESHDPCGAFSLLQLRWPVNSIADTFSDNRDLSVLSGDILLERTFPSKLEIVGQSLRRGHLHSLLIRAAICVEGTKGPKKGKIVSANDSLLMRCKSLNALIDAAARILQDSTRLPAYGRLEEVLLDECRLVALLAAGLGLDSKTIVNDTVEAREDATEALLVRILAAVKDAHKELSATGALTIPLASSLLPECIVPVVAVFNMCSDLLDLYGWGRRKRKTKRCAGALADAASALGALLDVMIAAVTS